MYDTAAVDAMCGLVAGLREQIVKMHVCRRELNARIAEIETLSEAAAISAAELSSGGSPEFEWTCPAQEEPK